MNFYEASLQYLKRQTSMYFPDYDLNNLRRYFEPNLYAWSPYFTASYGSETKEDMMKMFALILQNRYNLPKVINFIKNFDLVSRVTHNYDINYISSLQAEELLNEFNQVVTVKNRNSWLDYCMGLIDAANYLIANFTDYNSYVNNVRSNINQAIKGLSKIKGIGPVLSRNYLKEIGITELGKPDVHVKPMIEVLYNRSNITNEEFDELVLVEATKASVTPYILDRILWLIASGSYFVEDIKISRGVRKLRKNYLAWLDENIKNGNITI